MCEISCLEFKGHTADSLKLLVFRFSKNDKNIDKEKVDQAGISYLEEMKEKER